MKTMKNTFGKSIALLAFAAVFAMSFTGCKKDKKETNTTPSGPSTATFYYNVSNYDEPHTASDCFHFSFSYKDANGNMVEVNNATLPWTKAITANLPFTAKLEGIITYDEAEMPDDVWFVKCYQVSIDPNMYLETSVRHGSKEAMIQGLHDNPELLTFSKEYYYNGEW